MFFSLLIFVALAASSDALWKAFKLKHEKEYGMREEIVRRKVFEANLLEIDQLNARAAALNSSARYGVGPFADLSSEEFRSSVLMTKKIKSVTRDEARKAAAKHDNRHGFSLDALPSEVDYRRAGLVTAVKNQGQCGSCWAFSTTETVESAWLKAGHSSNTTLALAPQQIVDCDSGEMGCSGGELGQALGYVQQAGGLEGNKTYPYKAQDGQCQFKKSAVVAQISSYKEANSMWSESEMVNNLVKWGVPLGICVDAASWQHYQSGVMTWTECAYINMLDHCVQLVGYNKALGKQGAYYVRNSWTSSWGIDGYIHLEMGEDTCGLAHDPYGAFAQ